MMIETFHIIILLPYYSTMITLSTTSADNIAQQILSTSLYLLRLVDNIYNRPAATNPERFSFILQEYLKTTMAIIMARFFPPFGIGGVFISCGILYSILCTSLLVLFTGYWDIDS